MTTAPQAATTVTAAPSFSGDAVVSPLGGCGEMDEAWPVACGGTRGSMLTWRVAAQKLHRDSRCSRRRRGSATSIAHTSTTIIVCSLSNTVTPSRSTGYVARSHSNRVSLSLPLSHSHFQTNTAPLHPRVGGVNRLLDIIFVTFRSIISDSRSFRSIRDPNVLIGLLVERQRVSEESGRVLE